MTTFRQFLEASEGLKGLYSSLLNPADLARRQRLEKMVYDAYKRGDHRTAERLDAELEELEDRMDSSLDDMDDGSAEEDRGEPESDLDKDWSVQEEMGRIYARYISGELHLDDSETVEVDPAEARKKGWIVHQGRDKDGRPVQNFYSYAPITRERALANMLRGAIWDSTNLSASQPIAARIKSMTDEQVIEMAKDAYEWRRGLHDRYAAARASRASGNP
jgi:hypothetical protein